MNTNNFINAYKGLYSLNIKIHNFTIIMKMLNINGITLVFKIINNIYNNNSYNNINILIVIVCNLEA